MKWEQLSGYVGDGTRNSAQARWHWANIWLKKKKKSQISSDGWAKSPWIHLEMQRCSDLPDAAEPASTSAPRFDAVWLNQCHFRGHPWSLCPAPCSNRDSPALSLWFTQRKTFKYQVGQSKNSPVWPFPSAFSVTKHIWRMLHLPFYVDFGLLDPQIYYRPPRGPPSCICDRRYDVMGA